MEEINIEAGLIVDDKFIQEMKDKADKLLNIREKNLSWSPVLVKKGDHNPHTHVSTAIGDRELTDKERARLINSNRSFLF